MPTLIVFTRSRLQGDVKKVFLKIEHSDYINSKIKIQDIQGLSKTFF